MRNFNYLLISIMIAACTTHKNNTRSEQRLEIIRIDSLNDYFVFKTKSKINNEIIVLGEKDRMRDCEPFKRYILSDSIHEVSAIKDGSHKEILGSYLSQIDGIKIRDSGAFVKVIWNCNCFTR
jgi:hypothetical protein